MAPSSKTHQDDPATFKDDERLNSEALSPPYWQTEHNTTRSRASSGAGGQITLVDNTEEPSQTKACWARKATIPDYTIVEGSFGKLGSYVVFNCLVETTNVSLLSKETLEFLTNSDIGKHIRA
jgi:hypothetical protein